jgi:RNA polymerase sigma factor (sigma-70 family)
MRNGKVVSMVDPQESPMQEDPHQLRDRTLVARFQAGDESAFADIVLEMEAPLRRYMMAEFHLQPADEDDSLQDVWLDACTKLPHLRQPDSLRPWLYRIARNKVLQRLQRGRKIKVLSLDVVPAETRRTFESTDRLSPEKLFDRSWALTVLEYAMLQLKTEHASADKSKLFDCLKPYLTRDKHSVSYKNTAVQLKMTESAVKEAVYRLRQRYCSLIRQKIHQTVAAEEQLEEEIRDLFVVLAR